MSQRIEYIDFARGYAIFTIVCYHALQQMTLPAIWQKAIVFGGTGVHLFFLLSGFGLAWSSTKEAPLLFYRRRMSKVWLPYVLALTISWVAASTLGIFPDRWDAWLAGVALYQMFSVQYIESFGGHFWFVSAIFQFYLVFPLLIQLQRRLSTRWFLWITCSISVCWWLFLYFSGKNDLRVWNSFFLQFLWEFSLGMVLADVMRRQQKNSTNSIRRAIEEDTVYKWLFLPLGMLFTGIMIIMTLKMGETGRVFNDVPALLGYTALSVFVYRLARRRLPLLNRFFLWVSSFSYSLYLTHVLVLHLCLLAIPNVGFNTPVLLTYLMLALLAARLFEPVSRSIQRLAT